MSVANPYSQYVENQLNTASPIRLLIMAYDGAIKFGRVALRKMQERKLDEQSESIRKMQSILLELMSALNPDADKQLAARLDGLYTYMFDRLTQASIRDDAQALNEVIEMLTDLRSTWAEAEIAARTIESGDSSKPQRAA